MDKAVYRRGRRWKVEGHRPNTYVLRLMSYLLHSPPLPRPATVMRYRRRVFDRLDVEPVGLQRSNRRFPSRPRSRYADVDRPHAVLFRSLGAVGRGELRGKGSALARALEADPARRGPGKDAAILVGDRDDRVVEGGLYGRDRVRDVLLFLLRRAGAFAFGLYALLRRCSCCGGFSHFSSSSSRFSVFSSQFSVLGTKN